MGSDEEKSGEIDSKKTFSKRKIHMMHASLLKRILAFFIDLVIVNIFILAPFNSVIARFLGDASFTNIYQELLTNPEILSSLTPILIASSVLVLLYFIVLQKMFSQTIGMMIMNIYVIRIPQSLIGTRGAARRRNSLKNLPSSAVEVRPSFLESLLRNLFLIPVAPFSLLLILDPVFIFFNNNYQRLTEHLSRTMVVQLIDYDISNQSRWF